jgi:hypothetical protein
MKTLKPDENVGSTTWKRAPRLGEPFQNESAKASTVLGELLAANRDLTHDQKAALKLAISLLEGRQWDADILEN